METDGIAECFDRCACARMRRPKPGSPVRGASKTLVELVEREGLIGRTVLDLGSGLGGLAREMVARGARRADGLDLSPASVREATRLAAEAGLADRVTFTVGDAAQAQLQPHDIVVLDKVICCYPYADALLVNSVAAAGSVYAFVAPVSSGALGVITRAAIRLHNLARRLMRSSFRAYVHDLTRIGAKLRAAGFDRAAAVRRSMWQVAVYVRPRAEEAVA